MPYDETIFKDGAALDVRTEEQKLKDYFFHEIVVSASPVNWVEKPEADWRKFPDQDQNGSGSCVAQTTKKLALVLLWLKEKVNVVFSATDIYQQRSNKPGSGMMGVEAFDIWKNNGITLEQLAGSELMNDAQMDAEVIEAYKHAVGAVFKIGGHVGVTNGDFETVASVIQTTGKAVMVWFFFTGAEWSPQIPVIQDTNLTIQSGLRHSVAAVDFALVNGKKYLIIEDSAHFGGITRRLISEEFFKARNWFIRYPMSFVFQDQSAPLPDPQPAPVNPKPHHVFTTPFEFGSTSADVKALQDILKYEGFFPINTASTGYYGAITAGGVLKWQIKHNVAPLTELNSLQGRRAGSKTIAKLNELYV